MRTLPDGQTFPYADGTAIPIPFIFSSGATPHVETDRASYIVPLGKVALLQHSFFRIETLLVGVPSGVASLYLRVTRFNSDVIEIINMAHGSFINGDVSILDQIHNIVLTKGDTLTLASSDTGTGTIIRYSAHSSILEYNS